MYKCFSPVDLNFYFNKYIQCFEKPSIFKWRGPAGSFSFQAVARDGFLRFGPLSAMERQASEGESDGLWNFWFPVKMKQGFLLP